MSVRAWILAAAFLGGALAARAAPAPLMTGKYRLIAYVAPCPQDKSLLCATTSPGLPSRRQFALARSAWDEALRSYQNLRVRLEGELREGNAFELSAAPELYLPSNDDLFGVREVLRLPQ